MRAVRARVCRWPRLGVRTSNFYARYSTGKHEAALCLWNAKNGEKNPDNVPERRAHRVTHKTVGGGAVTDERVQRSPQQLMVLWSPTARRLRGRSRGG